MPQPIYTFDYTTDAGKPAFGCVSGRSEKEARTRLKRRYTLSDTEVSRAQLRSKTPNKK